MPTRHRVTAVGHMGRSVASCEGLDPIGWTNRADVSRQSAVGQTVQLPGDGRRHEAIRRAVSLSRCPAMHTHAWRYTAMHPVSHRSRERGCWMGVGHPVLDSGTTTHFENEVQ